MSCNDKTVNSGNEEFSQVPFYKLEDYDPDCIPKGLLYQVRDADGNCGTYVGNAFLGGVDVAGLTGGSSAALHLPPLPANAATVDYTISTVNGVLTWVLSSTFTGATGPAGAIGPQGPTGPTGPQGPAGADGGSGSGVTIADVVSGICAETPLVGANSFFEPMGCLSGAFVRQPSASGTGGM